MPDKIVENLAKNHKFRRLPPWCRVIQGAESPEHFPEKLFDFSIKKMRLDKKLEHFPILKERKML
ncbi:hypothetical protein [Methylovirgula sp. 4M-Z18]|uniref:hypothetical protein n=1 Tax=Methylovirgula sp. 4M-Z18 TaxID=2293567 RepID=UPI0011C02D78|nr:hypothetical protein [Methylovirgula sp. 4M-Z18]